VVQQQVLQHPARERTVQLVGLRPGEPTDADGADVWPQHQLTRDVQRVGDDGDRLAAAGPQVCALTEVSRDGGGRRTAVEADDLFGPGQLGRGTSDPLTRVAGRDAISREQVVGDGGGDHAPVGAGGQLLSSELFEVAPHRGREDAEQPGGLGHR
jgi:hypothetical protein